MVVPQLIFQKKLDVLSPLEVDVLDSSSVYG